MAKKRVFRARKISKLAFFVGMLLFYFLRLSKVVGSEGGTAAGAVGGAAAAFGAAAAASGGMGATWGLLWPIAVPLGPIGWVILGVIVIIFALFGGCDECGDCGGCGGCMGTGDSDSDGSDAAEDIPNNQADLESQAEESVCSPSVELPNGIDDDCDGSIDEEDCGDGIDNNGDGVCSETGDDCTEHDDCPGWEDEPEREECLRVDEECA